MYVKEINIKDARIITKDICLGNIDHTKPLSVFFKNITGIDVQHISQVSMRNIKLGRKLKEIIGPIKRSILYILNSQFLYIAVETTKGVQLWELTQQFWNSILSDCFPEQYPT